MPVGIIRSGEIEKVEEQIDIAGTVLQKSQVDEILTTSWKVVFKEENKHFFHCKGNEGKVCEIMRS